LKYLPQGAFGGQALRKMSERNEIIGIIAGGGQFPLMVADSIKKRGHRVVAVAHRDETDPALADRVDQIVWINLGQLGQLIKALKKNKVQKALMAGEISKRLMFRVKPDLKGLTLMSKIAIFHDDGILRSLAKELEREGIHIVSSASFVPELLSPPGCLTRRKPTKKEKEDIQVGWRVAKELGKMDIGQCVVVRRKTVLALEAMEGTDETILRGGRLAKEKAVVVKVCKPNQDLRFDVPSVGLRTVENMSEVKASVLALEAGKTLMFDKSEMIQLANRSGISIVCQKD
jgi:DUF1009 family protein